MCTKIQFFQAGLKEDNLEYVKLCSEEFKITPEQVTSLHGDASKIDATDDLKVSKHNIFFQNIFFLIVICFSIQCFIKCTMIKNGFETKSGLDVEKFVALNVAKGKDEAKIRTLAEKCSPVYKAPLDCNNAWEMFECFAKKEE